MIFYALVRKEIDGVQPYWFAVLAALFFLLLANLLEPMAGRPFSAVLGTGADDWGFLCGLLAFSLAHTLVAVEYTDGHIEFLDGLPVSRWMVFAAKVVAVGAPLAVLIVGTCGLQWGLAMLLGTPFAVDPTPTVLVFGLRFTAVLVAYAGMGLLASWAGGLGWGVLVLLVFAMLTVSIAAPEARPYVLFDGMLDLEWDHQEPVLLWGPIVAWSGVGVVCTAISGVLFLGPGRWLVAAGSWSATFVRIGSLGCGLVFFFMLTGLATCDVVLIESVRLLESTERADTKHFRFLYPTDAQAQAKALIDDSEAINAALGKQMHNPHPLYLDIEMLGTSRGHAGVFLGGKIRMSLDEDARDTLTHELAHAHAFALSGWKAKHQFDHVRFFEEGLAMHYEQVNSDRPPDHRWAGLAYATEQARFDLLVEDSHRARTHDGDQAYALGEVFVSALLEEHGDAAVACVLTSIGGIGDDDISGMSLWALAMGECGYDLDAVVARYYVLLEAAASDMPKPLPELSARLDKPRAQLAVTIEHPQPSATYVCRFRDDADTPRNQWETRTVRDGACDVPGTALSGTGFEYQLGFRLDGHTWPLHYKWATAEL